MKMKVKYITIEREYGSGGTEIAHRTAEAVGIPCYGHEILEEVAKKYGISVSEIERYEETVTNSFFYSVYVIAKAASGSSDMLTNEGHIHIAEQSVIKGLADAGSAVFLGHCASEALKDRPDVLNVFIRSSDECEKHNRIVSEYGIPESEADKTRKRFDKKRSNYYYANTVLKWDEMKNYDLVLDSSRLGIDGCVEVLKALFK